jgi:hypothetical protein
VLETYSKVHGHLAADGSLTVHLADGGLTLQPGVYWFSVQMRMNYEPGTSGALWELTTSDTSPGFPASWENPTNGYDTGCLGWIPVSQCFTGIGEGYLFTLSGS